MNGSTAVIVVRRQLNKLQTGANVYLCELLDVLNEVGFSVQLVFAPESSFGNRPALQISTDFLVRCDKVHWAKTIRLGRFFVSVSPRVVGRVLHRLLREVAARLHLAAPAPQHSRASEPLPFRETEQIARRVDMIAPDLVVAEYSALGPILDLVGTPQARKAILLHDLFSLRARATLDHQLSTDVKGFTLEEEAALCAHADILIYASKSERAIFKEYLPDRAHVWLAPSCKPLADIPPSGAPKALFMGVKHLGNLDAIAFLMTEIWPDVVAQKPDAELWIVGEIGSFLEPEWISLPGVKVLGVVKDLTSLGGADTLGLAPTRVGSGVSIKIADYLRLGMTAIASKTAMEGYGQTLDQSVHLAETAKEFSDKIVACLNREADAYHSGQRISFRESELRTVLKSAFRHDA